ncbi:hypothetical protein GOODEAATRI_004502, partial [Goodea atripinnis]
KPFMHPDGSAVVYNPAAGRVPQQGKTTPQPILAASQQQPANHIHSQPEVLSAQFSHMTLSQQPSSDGGVSTPDGRHYPSPYNHHPSPVMLQGAPPPQVTGYMVAGPSGGHPGVLQGQHVPLPAPGPNHTYPGSNAGPAAFSALNQPLLQQHTYIQQPVQQVA